MSRKLKILAASLLIVVVSTVFLAGAAFAANGGSGEKPLYAGDGECTCVCEDDCLYHQYGQNNQ